MLSIRQAADSKTNSIGPCHRACRDAGSVSSKTAVTLAVRSLLESIVASTTFTGGVVPMVREYFTIERRRRKSADKRL